MTHREAMAEVRALARAFGREGDRRGVEMNIEEVTASENSKHVDIAGSPYKTVDEGNHGTALKGIWYGNGCRKYSFRLLQPTYYHPPEM